MLRFDRKDWLRLALLAVFGGLAIGAFLTQPGESGIVLGFLLLGLLALILAAISLYDRW